MRHADRSVLELQDAPRRGRVGDVHELRVVVSMEFRAGRCPRSGDASGGTSSATRDASTHSRSSSLSVPLLELALTQAYVASRQEPSAVTALLGRAEASLRAPDLSDSDRACYFARWIDQRAYELNKRLRGSTPDHAAALALYESIPTLGAPPFALCRRENGIAWTKYHLGRRDEAVSHGRAALRHAGDGGSLRMRGMALNFLSRALDGDEAESVRRRALEIAPHLEDEELRLRLIR